MRPPSRTTAYIEVDGREFRLARDRDLVDVMNQIEAITRSEPAFVDLSDGERLVSVLISPGARVVVTVRPDHRTPDSSIDDWSLDLPFRDWE